MATAVFQICWHLECSTLAAASLRTWNSSAGIPSPSLALFVVMLPKAHLTSHSRLSGSRWVIIPSWLPGYWEFFFVLFFCVFLLPLLNVTCFCWGYPVSSQIPHSWNNSIFRVNLMWFSQRLQKEPKKGLILIMVVVYLLSHVWLFATPWTVALQVPLFMEFPGKNIGMGCHFLLQKIFLTQGSNPGLQHCKWILYWLSNRWV